MVEADESCFNNEGCTSFCNNLECPANCALRPSCCNRQLQELAWETHQDSLLVQYVEGKGFCLFAGCDNKEGEIVQAYLGEMYLEGSWMDKE
mmetsp:Transcript_52366/g.106781  ORF Transcript_52366/g.106781 Transcript_52366/m.106781 type:complete len:92 (-) Transcript_52366:8-283(-)